MASILEELEDHRNREMANGGKRFNASKRYRIAQQELDARKSELSGEQFLQAEQDLSARFREELDTINEEKLRLEAELTGLMRKLLLPE